MALRKIQSDMVSNLADLDFNSATLYGPLSVLGKFTTTDISYISASNIDVENITTRNNLYVSGDVTIAGNLSALGNISYIDTTVIVTSAMSITNRGTGPALIVNQTGTQPVANFQDDSVSVFYIADGGNVGIGSSNPSERLTVSGNISANGNIRTSLVTLRKAFVNVDSLNIEPANIGTAGRVLTLTTPAGGLGANRTLTLPDTTGTLATIDAAQTFTVAQTFRATNAIRSENSATQDAIILAGRAGGTNSYAVTVTPATLTSNRTVTLPDANTTIPIATQTLTFTGPLASRTFTFPDANATIVSIDAAQTLTNKIYKQPITVVAAGTYSLASTDASKIIVVGPGGGGVNLGAGVFTAGDSVTVINDTDSPTNVNVSAGVTMYVGGTPTTGATYSLPARRMLIIVCISATTLFYTVLG